MSKNLPFFLRIKKVKKTRNIIEESGKQFLLKSAISDSVSFPVIGMYFTLVHETDTNH